MQWWEIGRHSSSSCVVADDLMSRYSGIASTIDNGEKKQFHDQIHNRGGDINLDSISTQADSWQLTVRVTAIMSPVKIEFSMDNKGYPSLSQKVLSRCSVLVWQYIGVTPGPCLLTADCCLSPRHNCHISLPSDTTSWVSNYHHHWVSSYHRAVI